MHKIRTTAFFLSSVALTVGIASSLVLTAEAADDFRKICADAQSLYSAKRYSDAEQKYNQALQTSAGRDNPLLLVVLWSNLGAAYREDHKDADAERCFKRAISIADTRGLSSARAAVTAMQQYALLLRKLNRNFEAGEMESKALGGRPNAPLIAFRPQQGDASETFDKIKDGQNAAASSSQSQAAPAKRPQIDSAVAQNLEALKTQAEAHPESAQAWIALGAKANEAGDYETAVSAFRSVETRWPNYAKVCHSQLTYALTNAGNYSDAAVEAKKVINDNPKNPEGYLVLASISSNMGDLAGQVDAFQQFTERFPSDPRYAYIKSELDHLQAEQENFSKGPADENAPRAKWRTWSLANMPLKVYLKDPYQDIAWGKDKRGELPESNAMQLIQRALNSWSAASNGRINFVLVDTYDQCNIAVIPVPDAQGLEAEYQAGVTDYPREGTAVRARVRIALAGDQGQMISKRSFLEVALHEFGHAIGLEHSTSISDIMYPQQHSVSILEPSRHDAEVLNQLYHGRGF